MKFRRARGGNGYPYRALIGTLAVFLFLPSSGNFRAINRPVATTSGVYIYPAGLPYGWLLSGQWKIDRESLTKRSSKFSRYTQEEKRSKNNMAAG